MKYLHYETVELYKEWLDRFHVKDDADLLYLPISIFDEIARTEFNHDCEDIHYSLNWEEWYNIFLKAIYKEYLKKEKKC